MGVGPSGRSPAAGAGAAFVSGPYGGEQCWGDQSFGAADVQGLALGAEDHGDDGGVAGELADAVGGEDLSGQGGSGALTAPRSWSYPMVTTIWALLVVGALPPAVVARRHSSMRASARRRSACRGSRLPV